MQPIIRSVVRLLPAFVVGVLISAVVLWWLVANPPVLIKDFREVDGVAVRGGALDLHATANRPRNCTTEVRRWLWRINPDDAGKRQFFYLPGAPYSPPIPSGSESYVLTLQVPSTVPAGTYHYLGEAFDDCPLFPGLFSRRMRQSPDINVIVTNPIADRVK